MEGATCLRTFVLYVLVFAAPISCLAKDYLWFPKTPSDLKINKIRGDSVTLLHG